MRVFIAGATGVIGSRLVPLLRSAAHEVIGTTRTVSKLQHLREMGAEPVLLNLLDGDAVQRAVVAAYPDVVVHEATALSSISSLRRFDKQFAETNQLRTVGTDHLISAAQQAGARRFVAQSFAGWPHVRTGGPVKTEDDPFDPTPVPAMRTTLEAIRHLEAAVLTADGLAGVVLRYGGFYGPGTSLGEGGVHLKAVRGRRLPIVGDGSGVWSFVHIDDAATATVAAIERGAPGVYNIVDDEPAPVAGWLPALAAMIGAKPPRRVPVWLGRLIGGEPVVVLMTQARGASNAKAKRELGWQPKYASWRTGFTALGKPAASRTAA
jgi:2-alkyl-3-oxoalkanoate reductase